MPKDNVFVGILGAGQLSLMLVRSCLKLEIPFKVFANHDKEPACLITPHFFVGKLEEARDLAEFTQNLTHIIFENEFININLLKDLETKIEFVPSLFVIENLQNKLNQKKILQRLQVPTAEFLEFSLGSDLSSWINHCLTHFDSQVVFKWAMYGYDGKGTFIWSSERTLEELLTFCNTAVEKNVSLYAEKKIDFECELAMIGIGGEKFINYPLVISNQLHGVCKLVKGKATKLKMNKAFETKAIKYCHKLAIDLKIQGVFAVEFFKTKDDVLVNEIAPRVHNSGHYTIDACDYSQFDNHILSLENDQESPITKDFFAMLNILAPTKISERDVSFPIPKEYYWYGKTKISSLRKMGHRNVIALSEQELEIEIQKMILDENNFWKTTLGTSHEEKT